MTRFMPSKKWLVVALAVASVQTAAIGWMVWDRIQLLRNGREIVLPVVPVDPRSLFRGDYVILSYDAHNVPMSVVPKELDEVKPYWFYVTLKLEGNDWKPVGVTAAPVPQSEGQISLKARLLYGHWPVRPSQATPANPPRSEPMLRVRYGIESYFVPEGKGLDLEKVARDKKLAAVVAIDRRGAAAIKGLVIDGQRQYDEPLL